MFDWEIVWFCTDEVIQLDYSDESAQNEIRNSEKVELMRHSG